MRIISKHADYYDSAMAQGQDRSLVYMREMARFEIGRGTILPAELKPLADFMRRETPPALSTATSTKTHDNASACFGFVMLAGKLHPFAEISRRPHISIPGAPFFCGSSEVHFVYDIESVKAIFAEHGVDATKRKRSVYDHDLDSHKATLTSFFALAGDSRWHEHVTIHNLPALALSTSPLVFEVNPRLANFHFFRRMVGYEVYQELSMFLGNIASPDRTPVVIEDKYKIPQHGFDKFSFRRRPAGA